MHFYAVYNKTIFRNEENGYAIFSVHSKEANEYKSDDGSVICCGIIPVCTKNTPLFITGEPILKNDKIVIKVSEISIASNDREISIQYLSGDTFKGIGVKTAEKIIDLTGNDIFAFIQNPNAESIIESSIPEFKNGKAHSLIITIRNTLFQKSILEFLQCCGGTYSQSINLYEKYGSKAIQELKDDPYRIGYKSGIPFPVCDCIARKEGMYYLDGRRIQAMIYEAMDIISNSGNTYTDMEELLSVIAVISKNSAFPAEIPALIIASEIHKCKGLLCIEEFGNMRIYNKKLLTFENEIVMNLLRLQKEAKPLPFDESFVGQIEKRYNIKYSDAQKNAFNFLKSSGLKILCGYAGTGKTTVQKGLITAYTMMFPNSVISLCAPTGRAAQRMSFATGLPALTVHKLLDVKPFKDGEYKCKNKDDQLDSDLIIVDEASMIDTELFAILLQAVKNGASVILCGDPSQLQSVGAGNILMDLINSNVFEVNTLDVVYRQAEGSSIIYNANNIRKGCTDLKEGKDFELIRIKSQSHMLEKISELYEKYFDINSPFEFQLLSSTKKNDAGIYNLNKIIQSKFNSKSDEILFGKSSYRIGDTIMMLSNNYELDYYNGEIGIIKSIDEGNIKAEIGDKEIVIPPKLFKDIILAYAATIHKSQGSEFPTVVIALSKYPFGMLNRNLLYTAVTRAQNKVYLLSEGDAFETAVNREMIDSRKTSLCEKIVARF